MKVEVVFALPDKQFVKSVVANPGDAVSDVLQQCNMAAEFVEHDIDSLTVGIWGREVERSHQVSEGDRIEIYRPLLIDPRESRRELATVGKTMGSADTD